jgi:hypothetical protein
MVGASFTVAAVAQILRSKKSIAAISVEVDTAHSQFGGASLAIGSGYLRIADHSSFSFGTGDFTIEFWFRPTVFDGTDIIWDQRPNGSLGLQPAIYTQSGQLFYYTDAGNRITGGNLTTNTWQHIALCRSGTSTRMFINGTQTGSTYTDTINYVSSSGGVWIGADQYFGGNNSVGNIDEIRVSNSARYTANFTPSTTPFVNDASTLLLIHADGTDGSTFFEDDNGVRSQKGITALGNAQISTAQSKFSGTSALFDGTGDYLDIAPGNAFGTGDFTIEGWIYPTSVTGVKVIYDDRQSSADASKILFYMNGTSIFYYSTGNHITGSIPTANLWYHVAVSRSSGTVRMFINGTQAGSNFTDTNNKTVNSTNDFLIGQNCETASRGADQEFIGHIDEIRISNSARYTANFTAPTQPFVNDANTVLLVHADGTNGSTVFRDDNGAVGSNWTGRSAKTIQAIGNAQISTAQSKFGGASMLSDGTGDCLQIATNSDFAFGTGDFCFEFFIRPTTNLTSTYNIWDQRATGAGGGVVPSIYVSGNVLYYYTNGDNRIAYAITLQSGTWYHFALARSAGSTKMFLDGTQVGSTYTDTNSYVASQVVIGAYAATGSYSGSTPAYFDEIRISKGVARYTANFTPTTTAFVNDANTVLLIHADGVDTSTTFTDDIGTGRTQKGIQAIGNAQVDTAQSKFGGASALFDGTGDSLTINANSVFNFGTSDYTVEGWIRSSSLGATRIIFDTGVATQGTRPVFYVTSNGAINMYTTATGAVSSAGSTITTNTWYHVALVRYSGTTTIYVDGVSKASTGTSYSMSTTATMYVGAEDPGTTNSWNGHIDEVCVSNVARYTAAFTPPTTPFQNDANTVLLLHMDGTDASTVFTDDNGIAPYVLAEADAFTAPTSAFVNDGYTVALYKFENNGTDSGPNGYTLGTTGGYSSSTVKFGSYSGDLSDSTSDYFAHTTDRYFGIYNGSIKTDLTWECWVYYTSFTGASRNHADENFPLPNLMMASDYAQNRLSMMFGLGGSEYAGYQGKLAFMCNRTDGGLFNNFKAVGTNAASLNTWNHLALTYNVSTATFKGYLNGVKEFTVTGAQDAGWAINTHLTLGANSTSGNNSACFLDEVRISRTIRYGT